MRLGQRFLAYACALAAGSLTGVTGCAIYRDVPPSFARLAPPPSEITPVPDQATVVVVAGGGVYDGGAKAVTILMDDGTPIAQVVPRSYAVARIAPGAHWFTALVPEENNSPVCLKYLPGSFEAGKVYTFNTTSLDATAELSLFLVTVAGAEKDARAAAKDTNVAGKVLSKLSYMALDTSLVPQYRAKYREALDQCVKSVNHPPDAFAAKFPKPMPANHARERIDIPPPP